MASPEFDIAGCVQGVRAGSRAWIARAITMVESRRSDHRSLAQELLAELTPDSGNAHRLGITGVPGAGKSTTIDALGTALTGQGHKVAVLAVDPSSTRSGGSILGDKTRMGRLAADPHAFVRPSPAAGTPGGVARATREAMIVVEAAGFDVVIVETVGVGQSETTVAEMVDTFLLLTLARSGDSLQGIKKGVLELADVVAVNKADGPHAADAFRAARELAGALRILGAGPDDEAAGWQVPVLTCSAHEGTGLDDVWAQCVAHRAALDQAGVLGFKRRRQLIGWTWAMVREGLLAQLQDDPQVKALGEVMERQVLAGELTPASAAGQILALLKH